jgi:quercetin dioxygenase-like cupin family protein
MSITVPRFAVLVPSVQATEAPESGVVNRVVHADGDGLRVVMFGFAAGARLPAHTAPQRAIVEVVSGELELTLGDEELTAREGTWVYMDAGLVHAVAAARPAVMRLTLLPA